ncbi:MAG: type 4a pilus biogenesis protein PilO [Selenomonadaceae bacterium]|nr:type 4a pilus biogenesis protein PilO [Selenomonadaceae bacterium]MBQ1915077.1 type 4a pilus biogenesis protein PilO [Selenomonadaceae bacterium]
MRRPKGKDVFAIVCCSCSWMLAGFYFFLHEPWQEEISQVRSEEFEEQQKILNVENFMNAHRDMNEFSQETAKHQEIAKKAMPEELEQGEFLEFLQRLALGKQIELVGVVPQKESQERNVTVLPVQVKLKCNYFQLLDFLQGLQEGDRFMQVRNARIHSDHGNLVCQLDLAIFAMK